MTHLVRFQIQLRAGIFEHLEVCIFLAFLHWQKKSLTLGSEIMCHVTLMVNYHYLNDEDMDVAGKKNFTEIYLL